MLSFAIYLADFVRRSPAKRDEGGEGGIRTLEELSPLVVFKTTALNHYATSPEHTILPEFILFASLDLKW